MTYSKRSTIYSYLIEEIKDYDRSEYFWIFPYESVEQNCISAFKNSINVNFLQNHASIPKFQKTKLKKLRVISLGFFILQNEKPDLLYVLWRTLHSNCRSNVRIGIA